MGTLCVLGASGLALSNPAGPLSQDRVDEMVAATGESSCLLRNGVVPEGGPDRAGAESWNTRDAFFAFRDAYLRSNLESVAEVNWDSRSGTAVVTTQLDEAGAQRTLERREVAEVLEAGGVRVVFRFTDGPSMATACAIQDRLMGLHDDTGAPISIGVFPDPSRATIDVFVSPEHAAEVIRHLGSDAQFVTISDDGAPELY